MNHLINVLSSTDSGGMFERGFMDIFGSIYDLFVELIYNVITFILQIVYSIESCFYYLAGLSSLKPGLESGDGISQLFPTYNIKTNQFDFGIFADAGGKLATAMGFMLIVGIGMVIALFVFALVKGLFNQEGKTSGMISMAIGNSLKAIVYMALAPLVILIVISTISFMLSLILGGLSNALTGGGSTSIAYNIFEACIMNGKADTAYLQLKDAISNNQIIISLDENYRFALAQTDAFGIDFVSIRNLVKGTNLDFQLNGDFNYGIGFIGGVFTLVCLALLVIRIAERLFNLLIDYILSIPAIATMPYDGGQRYGSWCQLFMGSLLNFSGSVLAMLVYLYVISFIAPIIDNIESTNPNQLGIGLFKAVLLLVIIIGGAFTCVKAGNIVSQLIGSTAAQAESNSLHESMHLASMGARATGAVALGVGGAFLAGVKARGGFNKMQQGSAKSKNSSPLGRGKDSSGEGSSSNNDSKGGEEGLVGGGNENGNSSLFDAPNSSSPVSKGRSIANGFASVANSMGQAASRTRGIVGKAGAATVAGIIGGATILGGALGRKAMSSYKNTKFSKNNVANKNLKHNLKNRLHQGKKENAKAFKDMKRGINKDSSLTKQEKKARLNELKTIKKDGNKDAKLQYKKDLMNNRKHTFNHDAMKDNLKENKWNERREHDRSYQESKLNLKNDSSLSKKERNLKIKEARSTKNLLNKESSNLYKRDLKDYKAHRFEHNNPIKK